LAESTIGLFKTEVVKRHDLFKSLAEVEFALMEWVDWYNNAVCIPGSTTWPRSSMRVPTTLNTSHADRRWSDTEAGPLLVTVRSPTFLSMFTGRRV
jgi:hypothetical protein